MALAVLVVLIAVTVPASRWKALVENPATHG
jgi:hypothetical protein